MISKSLGKLHQPKISGLPAKQMKSIRNYEIANRMKAGTGTLAMVK